ncbi:MAG: hypothetical protein RDV48_18860 [Candidatus Eremiobacteraeota bacterium]|nr:hypothetical protein [Candidatus Eremiobacteraeota bacterium]
MGDTTISGSPQRIASPQNISAPKAPAPPPAPPPKTEAAPAESTRLSAETQGAPQKPQGSGTASSMAHAFGDAAKKALGFDGKDGWGEKIHQAKEKVNKQAARAEKNQEGVPEEDMKKLKSAANGGFLKKATAAAMLGTDIKGLPDAIKQTEQWNNLPQGARDAAVTGLKLGGKVLGAVDSVVHPD